MSTAEQNLPADGGWARLVRLVERARTALAALAGAVTAAAAVLEQLSLVLGLLGGLLAMAGAAHRARARLHDRHEDYRRDRGMRRLARSDRRLANTWIVAGVIVAVSGALAATAQPVCVITSLVLGGAVSVVILVRAWVLGTDLAIREGVLQLPGGSKRLEDERAVRAFKTRAAASPAVPVVPSLAAMFGSKTPAGEISAYLTLTLVVVMMVVGGYVGVALGYVGSAVVGVHADEEPAKGGDERASRRAPTPEDRELPYEALCRALPDPADVGAGLGGLFAHDGAVQAGCGEPARRVAGGLAVARGACEGRLRSFAVRVPGRRPVLLYGEAASEAERLADAGALVDVEAVAAGPGQLVLLTALAQGTTVMVRASPALQPPTRPARRCSAITEIARSFTTLPPPLARLWAWHVLAHGWAWPERTGSVWTLTDRTSFAQVGTGTCSAVDGCRLTGEHPEWRASAGTRFSVADLKGAVPARASP